jgi:hypothetical protein
VSEQKKPEFHPAPGYILGKPLTREELAKSSTSLSLPDNVGKEKDSVGIAEVLECGNPGTDIAHDGVGYSRWEGEDLSPGDLVAYIPFTDAIIMDGYEKRNLIAYKNIMAVSRK